MIIGKKQRGIRRIVLSAAVATIASCAVAGWSRAQAEPSEAAKPADAPAAEKAEARKPLMSLLDQAGIGKSLDDAGISIYGWIEGSASWAMNNPSHSTLTARYFDINSDRAQVNQLDLNVERTVDLAKKNFDIGFHVECLYGTDARFLHSNGMDFYGPGDTARGPQLDPEYQFDVLQAYLDFAVPVGNGLKVRVGKFVTIIGLETVNPTTSPLYSHSYLYTFVQPNTQTGVLATYNITDKLAINAGITRGWEQSLKDDNGCVDFLGGITWTASDELTITLNNSTGPQQANNNDNYRILTDLIVTYTSEPWTLSLNADLGWEQNSSNDGGDAWYYGVAGYVGYKLNNYLTFNGRGEWFNDTDGSRGLDMNIYETTLGVTITPLPDSTIGQNLKIRPEVRWDYAERALFDDGSDHNQYTLAVDAYFAF